MALTITAAGSATSTSSSATLAFDSGATWVEDDLIVVCIAADNAGTNGASSISSVTDAAGHTYTQRVLENRDPGAAGQGITLAIYTAPVGAAGMASTDDITVNFSPNTTAKAAAVWRVAPGAGEAVEFQAAGSTSGFSTTQTITTGSITSGHTVIGAAAGETNQAWTADGDSSNGSWSAQVAKLASIGTDTSVHLATQYKTVTGTATQTYNPDTTTVDFAIGYVVVAAVAGNVTINTQVASLDVSAVQGTVTPGAVSKTAQVATLTLAAIAGSISGSSPATVTGQVATVDVSAVAGTVTPGAVAITAQVATLTFSGVAGAVTPGAVSVTAQVASVALAAQPGAVTAGAVSVDAQAATLTLTANPGTLSPAAVTVTATPASLTLTALAGTVTPGAVTVTAQVGALTPTANPGVVSVAAVPGVSVIDTGARGRGRVRRRHVVGALHFALDVTLDAAWTIVERHPVPAWRDSDDDELLLLLT